MWGFLDKNEYKSEQTMKKVRRGSKKRIDGDKPSPLFGRSYREVW
jgi:hypothetical protein